MAHYFCCGSNAHGDRRPGAAPPRRLRHRVSCATSVVACVSSSGIGQTAARPSWIRTGWSRPDPARMQVPGSDLTWNARAANRRLPGVKQEAPRLAGLGVGLAGRLSNCSAGAGCGTVQGTVRIIDARPCQLGVVKRQVGASLLLKGPRALVVKTCGTITQHDWEDEDAIRSQAW